MCDDSLTDSVRRDLMFEAEMALSSSAAQVDSCVVARTSSDGSGEGALSQEYVAKQRRFKEQNRLSSLHLDMLKIEEGVADGLENADNDDVDSVVTDDSEAWQRQATDEQISMQLDTAKTPDGSRTPATETDETEPANESSLADELAGFGGSGPDASLDINAALNACSVSVSKPSRPPKWKREAADEHLRAYAYVSGLYSAGLIEVMRC